MWRHRSRKIQRGIAGQLSRRFHRPVALSRTQWRDTGRSQNYRKLTGEAQLSDHPAVYRRTQIDTGRIPDSCRLWVMLQTAVMLFHPDNANRHVDLQSPVQRLRHIECGHPTSSSHRLNQTRNGVAAGDIIGQHNTIPDVVTERIQFRRCFMRHALQLVFSESAHTNLICVIRIAYPISPVCLYFQRRWVAGADGIAPSLLPEVDPLI